MSVTIQIRGDTAANWTSVNPTLHQRELGVETDTLKLKVGDGVTAWTSLAYWEAGALPLAGGTMTGELAPAVVALTDAATIIVDASKGNDFRVTLGGNRTMGAPSNPVDGQKIIFQVTQDATGSRTLTWPTGASGDYSFGGSSAPTLSTAAGDTDLIAFVYNSAKARWLYLGSALGF